MKPAIFHRLAQEEFDAAIQWHEQRSRGLGLDLLEEVRRTIERIQENPQAGQQYKKTELRYLLVRQFPYIVFYLEQPESLWIAAVAHARRRPGYWRRRKS